MAVSVTAMDTTVMATKADVGSTPRITNILGKVRDFDQLFSCTSFHD